MKKITVSLCFVFALFSTYTFGQKYAYGVYAGANISTIHWDSPILGNDFYKFRFGPTVGIHLTRYFGNNISVRTGLAFEQKGGKADITFTDENGVPIENANYHFKLDYIALPLYFQYNFGDKIQPIFFAGMSLGYLAQQTHKSNSSGALFSDAHETEKYNRLDHTILGGAGLHIFLSEKLNLEIRGQYGLGLTELGKEPILAQEGKNRAITMLVGCSFRI